MAIATVVHALEGGMNADSWLAHWREKSAKPAEVQGGKDAEKRRRDGAVEIAL